MSRRRVGIIVLLVLALGAATGLFLYLFKPVDRQIDLPPKGEAAYNPLYALKQSLLAQGIRATSYPSLNPTALQLGREDTLVLYTQPEAVSAEQSRRLLAWVKEGGHLLMPGPGWSSSPGTLATSLGLSSMSYDDDDEDWDYSANCSYLRSGHPPKMVETNGRKKLAPPDPLSMCDARFTSTRKDFVMSAGDATRGYHFGRLALGRGVVTVAPTDLLSNTTLEDPAATALAYQLLSPRLGRGQVHLVYSADVPSLWRLTLFHGWMAVLPATLALIAWLLMRSQRFGPRRPAPSADRRALLEHVQASGEMAFRRGRGSDLHAALLSLFGKRLARREPLIAALEGEGLVQALAARVSLDPARVRQALFPVGLPRPDVFLQCMSTLLLMRNRL